MLDGEGIALCHDARVPAFARVGEDEAGAVLILRRQPALGAHRIGQRGVDPDLGVLGTAGARHHGETAVLAALQMCPAE